MHFRRILAAASMAALKHNSSGGAFRPFTCGYSLLIPRPSVCLLVFFAMVSLAGSSVSVAGLPSSSAVRQWVARPFPLGYWQRAGFPPIIELILYSVVYVDNIAIQICKQVKERCFKFWWEVAGSNRLLIRGFL